MVEQQIIYLLCKTDLTHFDLIWVDSDHVSMSSLGNVFIGLVQFGEDRVDVEIWTQVAYAVKYIFHTPYIFGGYFIGRNISILLGSLGSALIILDQIRKF